MNLTQIQNDKIKNAYIIGKKVKEIAKSYNCSLQTVYNIAKANKLSRRVTNLSSIDIEKIIKLYYDLNTIAHIAKKMNISSTTVSYHIKKNNLVCQSEILDKNKKEKIISLSKDSLTVSEIKKIIGCNNEHLIKTIQVQNKKEIDRVKNNKIILTIKNKKEMNKKIKDLFESNHSFIEISKILGYSRSFVSKICSELGCKMSLKERRVITGYKRRKFKCNDLEKIINMYKSGISTEVIGKEYCVSGSTVSETLKRSGLQINQYATRLSKNIINIEEAYKMYSEGMSLKDIGKHYNVTSYIIQRRLKDNGHTIRPKCEKIIFDEKKAIDLYNEGKTILEISNMMNLSKFVINKALLNASVPMRSPSHPSRIEKSRLAMSIRVEEKGCIKIGKNEFHLINLLKEKYGEVVAQFKIKKGGHHYDAFAGNILWELDEPRHRNKKEVQKDIRYDKEAYENSYEVRRIWLEDLFKHGLDKWHNYQ